MIKQFLDNPSDDVAADTSNEPCDDDFEAEEDLVTSRISSLQVSLDLSPIDQMKIEKKRYAEGKIKMIDHTIRKKQKLEPCKEQEEYYELLEQLKKKFNESTKKSEELQVLTVLPQSWALQRINEKFGATKNMARKAKELVVSKGVLSTPNSWPGKTLSDRTVQLVKEFYLSDAVSRIMGLHFSQNKWKEDINAEVVTFL